MSAKGNDRKEIKKRLQQYLKDPSDDLKSELIESQYLPLLKNMWRKLPHAKLQAAVKLLARDNSEGALPLLREMAVDKGASVPVRIEAIEAIEERGESLGDDSPKPRLKEMLRIATRDDAQTAGELAKNLDENEMEAWAELLAQKGAVNALGAAGASVTGKRSKKALKRAAYELRAGGVEVPDWEEKGESVLKPPPKDDPVAFGTIPDGSGKQAIFLYLPDEAGGVHFAQAVIDEDNGMEDYQAADATRGSARGLLKQLRSNEEMPLPDIPLEHAAYLLDRAAARSSEKGFATPREYPKTRSLLKKLAEGYVPPDPKSLISGEVTIADAREAVELFESPWFVSWIPDAQSLELCRNKLDQALSSTIVISEPQRLEQIKKAFEDAASEYLTPENRTLLAYRLEEAARILAWNDDIKQARRAMAVEKEIKDSDSVPRFFVEMFRRIFPDVEEKIGDKADNIDETPTSNGGIIIP